MKVDDFFIAAIAISSDQAVRLSSIPLAIALETVVKTLKERGIIAPGNLSNAAAIQLCWEEHREWPCFV